MNPTLPLPVPDHDSDMETWIAAHAAFHGRDRHTQYEESARGVITRYRERCEQAAKAAPTVTLKQTDVGEGWMLLPEGTPLKPGDGFLSPYFLCWIDYACRPDMFRGFGKDGDWYHVPKRDYAHTWPWRRRNPLYSALKEILTDPNLPRDEAGLSHEEWLYTQADSADLLEEIRRIREIAKGVL